VTKASDEQRESSHIGERPRHDAPIELAEYDSGWPGSFEALATSIREALGRSVVQLEHAGSTSVPGITAKPIIDMGLVVPDSTDENEYVPALEAIGYVLRIREPDWFEHRLLRFADPAANLHVFSEGCSEVERMLTFRDYLRANAEERDHYEAAKRDLARHTWAYVQDYADAKSEVVEGILERAQAAGFVRG
jgi:GrpB-like predicted nucleotidyltransferase (UPF0157 family)